MAKKYTESDMISALTAIKADKNPLSIRAASRIYNIPRPTLQNRIHERTKKSGHGPCTILTKEEEQKIVNWLVVNHTKGFPRRKHDVQCVVKDFLVASPRENPFKNNLPGDTWYNSFLRRHPELAVRTPEAITDASSKVSEANIRNWFNQINTYLIEKNYSEILNDPTRIFNGDETNFMMCPKGGKVLAPRGAKNIYETDRGQAKENVTVMFSFSASGNMTPPLVVFPYKRMPSEILQSIPEGIKWLKSDSGWMTSEVFYDYIKDIFYPSIIENKIALPIILYVDGHKTHLTYALSKLCEELKIILICLYPNSTRILQPADVSVFKPVKTGWQRAVQNWRIVNVGKKLSKVSFTPILKNVIETSVKEKNIKNGFRACGLFPFDANAIDYSKCLGKNSREFHVTGEHDLVKTLTFKEFAEFAGENKIEELKHSDEYLNTHSEDFSILLKIYKRLSAGEIQYEDIQGEDLNLNDDPIEFETEDIEDFSEPKCRQKPKDSLINEIQTIPLEDCEIQNYEIVDEIDQNLVQDIPIIFLNQSSIEITDFLSVPETPVRTGNRNTERRSFIISSTPFQKAEEIKIEKKITAANLKEEKLNKRIENKKLKEQKARIIAQRKVERMEIKEKKKQKINKSNKNENINMSNKENSNRFNFLSTTNSSETATNNILSDILSDTDSHIKNNNTKEAHVRQLFGEPQQVEQKNPYVNDIEVSGICFECAGHITIINKGIVCLVCKKRKYHINCAIKMDSDNNMDDFNLFSCKVCIVSY